MQPSLMNRIDEYFIATSQPPDHPVKLRLSRCDPEKLSAGRLTEVVTRPEVAPSSRMVSTALKSRGNSESLSGQRPELP